MFLRIFQILFLVFLTINLYGAEIFLYLNLENNERFNSSLYIKSITFLDNSLKSYRFSVGKKIHSMKKFNQYFLKKIILPKGFYNKIIVEFKNYKVSLSVRIKINKNNYFACFLIWNVRASIKNKKFFPILYFRNQEIPLRGELLFVTSKIENALFFIRVDKNQVCAVMKINGAPVEMVLSCNKDKIFILTQEDKDIKVVEVSTFKKSDVFLLPYIISPDLITKYSNNLIIGDSENNRLLMINNNDGSIINSKEIGEKISDIVGIEEKKLVIFSSYNEQRLYFLDENLNIVRSIKLDCNPSSLYFYDNYLFVSESNCNIVLKMNLNTGRFDNQYRIIKPYRILSLDSNVYITGYSKKVLYILHPKQSSYSKKIRLSIIPERIDVYKRRGWIYISAKKSKKIEVIDLNSEQKTGIIELGAIPFDIKIGRTLSICR